MDDDATLRILDAWIRARHDYEQLPPRPTGPFFGGEMARWEEQRHRIEQRVYDTGLEFRAMCGARAAFMAALPPRRG